MTDDQAPNLLYMVLLLVLVASSLVSMRLPIGKALKMAADGHFWVEASVNGHQAPFLVDSGASFTTISRQTANQASVETGMRVAMVETANGTVQMRKARAQDFSVGAIHRSDFPIQVNDHDDSNVLGMNFLSSLSGWRVEANYLVLQP